MQLSYQQSGYRQLKPVILTLLFIILWPHSAVSQGVPQDLASLTRSLLKSVEPELKQPTDDKKQDAIRRRARDILRQAGVLNWSRKPVSRSGSTTKKLKSYKTLVGDNEEKLELVWDRKKEKLSVRIKANKSNRDADDEFDLELKGRVVSQNYGGNGEATLIIQPDDPAISVVTGEELKALRASVFGKWRNQDGDIWEISEPNGNTDDPDAAYQLGKQVENLSSRVEILIRSKVHIWKNTDTNEIVIQNRFKRLEEPFEYIGKDYSDPATRKQVAALEKQLEILLTKSKPLPVDTNDPAGMRKISTNGGASRRISIKVTDKDNYSWIYDEALLSSDRITAKRTLRNKLDLKGVKYPKVVQQLIASWSPPEWIELNIVIEHEQRQISLSGLRWRLKWTASADDLRVKRIHTPYSKKLALQRESQPTFKIEFVTADAPYEVIKDLTIGTRFRIELVFDKDPNRSNEPVSVVNKRSGQTIELVAQQSNNPKIFRTPPVDVFEDLGL